VGSVVLKAHFGDREKKWTIGGATFRASRYGLVVEVALVKRGEPELPPTPTWVPAIVDTGYSGEFAIAEDHLQLFGGRGTFPFKGWCTLTYANAETGLGAIYDADIWIRSDDPQSPSFKLELNPGFVVPEPRRGPAGHRIPVVGVSCLSRAKVVLMVHYGKLRFRLRKPA